MKRFLARVMSTAVVVVSISLLSGCEGRERFGSFTVDFGESDDTRRTREYQQKNRDEKIRREKEKEEKEAISLAARIAEQERHMGATAEEAAALVLQDNEDGDNDHPDLQ
jgi:hypothetical protein